MKDFIYKVYSSEYFAIGLFIAIAILSIAFFVVLILAIKDAKKANADELEENPPKPEENPTVEENIVDKDPLINTKDFAFTSEIKMPDNTPIVPPTPKIDIPGQDTTFEVNPFSLIEEPKPKTEEIVFPVEAEKEFTINDPFAIKPEPPITNQIPEPVKAPESLTALNDLNRHAIIEESLQHTSKIPSPEQFSSVYVDQKPVPKTVTIEFDIKQPAIDIAPSTVNPLPQQVSTNNVVASQLPKLATSKPEEVVPIPNPQVTAYTVNPLEAVENETYQINRR